MAADIYWKRKWKYESLLIILFLIGQGVQGSEILFLIMIYASYLAVIVKGNYVGCYKQEYSGGTAGIPLDHYIGELDGNVPAS